MPDFNIVKGRVEDADHQTGGNLITKLDAAHSTMISKGVPISEPWEVYVLLDASGSMSRWYDDNTVRNALQRFLGFALLVDDDGQVPIFTFGEYQSEGEIREYNIDLTNYHDFVERNRIDPYYSTPMTEALQAAARKAELGELLKTRLIGGPKKRTATVPKLIAILSDGLPDNPASMTATVKNLSYGPAALKALYMGNNADGWRYLQGLDNDIPVGRGGRLFDNVSSKKFNPTDSDAKFYADMLDELPKARAAMRQHGLLV